MYRPTMDVAITESIQVLMTDPVKLQSLTPTFPYPSSPSLVLFILERAVKLLPRIQSAERALELLVNMTLVVTREEGMKDYGVGMHDGALFVSSAGCRTMIEASKKRKMKAKCTHE